ncbi:hypothetical protein, partial [Akkermansia glycaniphila]|uniref:hypothetical protein n=1 Tax=Akkermansia glycaniphila TaxID=1679444 RepID=UPI001C02E3B9
CAQPEHGSKRRNRLPLQLLKERREPTDRNHATAEPEGNSPSGSLAYRNTETEGITLFLPCMARGFLIRLHHENSNIFIHNAYCDEKIIPLFLLLRSEQIL